MSLESLNKKIESSSMYIFLNRHKRVINIIQGIIIIGLLIGLNSYLFTDHQIKKEIAKNCGWGKEDFFCVCEKTQANVLRNRMENKLDYNISNVSVVE